MNAPWQPVVRDAVAIARERTPEFDDAWFDDDDAVRSIAFFPTYLRLTKAEWAGDPFWLTAWEAEIVAQFFGWKRPDGTRVYRRLGLWIGRKNGKTEFLAGLCLLAIVKDGEYGGEGYCIARDKDQARIPFDKMVEMVGWAPKAFADDFDPFKTSLVYTPLSASIKPLSGTSSGKHGLNMSVLAGDEVHEWPNDELYTFVHQSSAGRRQASEFLASTAGKKGTYGEEFFEHCKEVLNDPALDPELLVVIFAADPDDDWQAESTWAKANPSLGISPKIEYLRAEAHKARLLPRLENDFRRYHLDQWVAQEVRWLPIDAWRRCTSQPDNKQYWRDLPEAIRGRRVFPGLDLAEVSDFNALVYVAPPDETCDRWIWVPRLWIPEGSLERYPKRDRERVERWISAGAITVTPGNSADYDLIETAIYEQVREFDLEVANGPAVDRWNAISTITHLVEAGLPAVPYGQGYASMSGPMKRIEAQVLNAQIEHGSHPVLDWMASNIQVKPDDAGNLKPTRKNRQLKIDGIVAGIMGTGLALGEEPEDQGVEIGSDYMAGI